MARPRQRVRLENGPKLDINKILGQAKTQPGSKRPTGVHGWMHVKSGSLEQSIELVSFARPYGGRQWYFLCPRTGRRVSVLWKPPGARYFASRQSWGREVAYGSQFQSPYRRACSGRGLSDIASGDGTSGLANFRPGPRACTGEPTNGKSRGLKPTKTPAIGTYCGVSPGSD
jgi:hypothetical protein